MKHNYCAEYKNVRIRPIKQEDIENLRNWRNNSDLSKYLQPINYITPEMQQEWYENYKNDNDIITFAIEETKELKRMVGSVSLYSFNGEKAKAGKIVIGDPEARGKGLAFLGELLALYLGFQKLGINYYETEVHKENASSQKLRTKLGFLFNGEHEFINGGIEEDLYLTREHFEEIHPFCGEIKIYSE